jgi:hypothetical protein
MQRHQITNDFYLDEFERSQTATRHSINNSVKIAGHVYGNICRLCSDVLQPVRDHIGAVINVSSGYRSLKLNRRVGGVDTSQHVSGLAADINAVGKTPMELAREIVHLQATGKVQFDQLILEFGQWVHISTPGRWIDPRGEILTAVKVPRKFRKPKTVYVRGLYTQEDALRVARAKQL